MARLSKRLRDHHAVAEETALWVVESWALALGKITAADLRQQRRAGVSKPAVADAASSFHRPVHEAAAASITYVPPKRGKGWLVVLSLVVLLCVGGAAAWYFKLLPLPKTPPPAAAVTTVAPKETPPIPVASAVPTIATTADRASVDTES